MMCQPSGPESQSDELLGFAVSKHSSTYQQFSNPPLAVFRVFAACSAIDLGESPCPSLDLFHLLI
jgi:hypothetical protein